MSQPPLQVHKRRRSGEESEKDETYQANPHAASVMEEINELAQKHSIDQSDREENVQAGQQQNIEEAQQESVAEFKLDENFITCEVCYEIIHNPVNCSPCNHKFCAACLYRWLDLHHTCPKCRYVIKEPTKDVFASHVCVQYLSAHPERSRSKEFLSEMDKFELEYIEKLIKRSRYSGGHRHYPIDEADEEAAITLDRENGSDGPKRLFLGNQRRYREREWVERACRLREQLGLPKRDLTPPPEDRSSRRHAYALRDMMRLIEFGDSMQDPSFGSDDEEENSDDTFIASDSFLGRRRINNPLTPNPRRVRALPPRAHGVRLFPGFQVRYGAIAPQIRHRHRHARPSHFLEADLGHRLAENNANNPPPSPSVLDTRRSRSEPILRRDRNTEDESEPSSPRSNRSLR